jgi:uncharacterized membrane protein YfcA
MVLALLFTAFGGLMVGVEILRIADPEYARLAMGFFVVVSALSLLRDVELPGAGSRRGPVVAAGRAERSRPRRRSRIHR